MLFISSCNYTIILSIKQILSSLRRMRSTILSALGLLDSTLNLSNNKDLESLWCYSNSFNTLDISHNTALTVISGSNYNLTSLDVSNNTALKWLYCYTNQLSSLDLSNDSALEDLRCHSNLLTNLDVSNNTALTFLWCHYNPYLTEIWLKTGQSIPTFRYDSSKATICYKD